MLVIAGNRTHTHITPLFENEEQGFVKQFQRMPKTHNTCTFNEQDKS